MSERGHDLPPLVVLASTYPRYAGDHEPSFVHELSRRLAQHFQVTAVVPHAAGSLAHEVLDGVQVVRYRYAPAWLETLVNDGGMVNNLRRSPWKWLLVPSFIGMQWLGARRHARKGAIVHVHWLLPQGLVAWALGAPYMVTCHGADVYSLRGKIAMRAKQLVAKRARTVSVVSRAMRAPVDALGSARSALVMPMGVDLRTRFTHDPAVPRDTLHLLFVGRLVEKKGVDVLLRAMPRVLAAHPDVRLSVVGHGPLEQELRALASSLGVQANVRFLGPLPQTALPDMYRRASLLVAPFKVAASGDVEGLGLVSVEALGCACPVVASAVDGARDVFDGLQGAVLVPPGDPAALAAAIVDVLGDSRSFQSRVVDDLEVLRERFDWESVATDYARALKGLLVAGS
jgi:glycosyltransferase involved in cell wall biosynthesis